MINKVDYEYAKCSSMGCQFYNEKMEFNCEANEDLCERCMTKQQKDK